jgi:pimeloyl-ACP methyl ester carboxylesterase
LLRDEYRIFALDQRGHGDSDHHPEDVSREAFVADCAEAIRQIGRGPVTLVGQSMGANTAMLVAAAHPDLVRSLVVIEGSPDGPDPPDPDPEVAASIRRSLSAWPVPLADESAVEEFFRNKGFDPAVWTAGLEHWDDGLWPSWDLEKMVGCMTDQRVTDRDHRCGPRRSPRRTPSLGGGAARFTRWLSRHVDWLPVKKGCVTLAFAAAPCEMSDDQVFVVRFFARQVRFGQKLPNSDLVPQVVVTAVL